MCVGVGVGYSFTYFFCFLLFLQEFSLKYLPEIQFLRHKQYATSALLSHMRTMATVLYLFRLLEIS